MSDQFSFDVFLSYSSKDRAVVRDLAERLQKDGLRVWFDDWEILPGDSIPSKIDEGLEHSRVMVFCMSTNAFGSDWATLENDTFRFRDPNNKERRFIPLRLDDAPIKSSLALFSYINWISEDRDWEYAKLLKSCRPTISPGYAKLLESFRLKSPIVEGVKAKPKFELFTGKKDQFYFRLRAGNGEPILQSEGYDDKSGAKNGIASVKENAPKDERYVRKDSKDGQHYFVLRAGNNETIGTSERYKTAAMRDKGIEAVKHDAPGAPTVEV